MISKHSIALPFNNSKIYSSSFEYPYFLKLVFSKVFQWLLGYYCHKSIC